MRADHAAERAPESDDAGDMRRVNPADGGHQIYLKYLDKEMTIMGILSAFSVFAPAVVLDHTFGSVDKTLSHLLWTSQRLPISLGSIALLLAALYFYRQRSDLAFYYGQIAISLTKSRYPEADTTGLIRGADRWSAWSHYFTAFFYLTLGFGWYGLAFLTSQLTRWRPTAISCALAFVVIAALFSQHKRVFEDYDEEFQPWAAWWADRPPRRPLSRWLWPKAPVRHEFFLPPEHERAELDARVH